MMSSIHICDNASTRQVQPPKEPKVVKTDAAQWKNQVVQEKYKKQKCQAQVIVCNGKKSQETKFMQPKKPRSYMWSVTKKIDVCSKEPAIKYKKKNQVSMEEDQRSQVPTCIKKNCQTSSRQLKTPEVNVHLLKPAKMSSLSNDKTCQENMWPVKPQMNMWLPKPVTVRRLFKDKKCQFTRCSLQRRYSTSKKSENKEDTILDVTNEKLSPRSQKSQVTIKYKYREENEI